MELRQYQAELLTTVRQAALNGKKKILMVLSTGGGKTAILFDIAKRAVDKGGKVLLLSHRRDLVLQTAKKFSEYGIDTGIIMAGIEPDFTKAIQVVSVWTYSRRLALKAKELNSVYVDASLILIDEAHRSLSPVFTKVMDNYTDKIVIGCTATPCLSSGAAMGKLYDSLVDPIPIQRLIDEKWLVPCIYYSGSHANVKDVKTVMGDLDIKELGKRVDKKKLIGDIVDNWFRIAPDRQTILFGVNRKHAKHLCESFVDKGIKAIYLDAFSPDKKRAQVLTDFNNKDIQMIVNVALFQEFLDAPITGCIDIARNTKSMGLFRQMVGRGLRPYPGKENLIVIDHGDCIIGQHLGFIEDPIEWSLDGKQIAWKKPKAVKKEKVMMTCDECRNIFTGNRCPRCGLKVKFYTKKVAVAEAELERLTRGKVKKAKVKKVYSFAEKRYFYGQLKQYRIDRDYQEGWIAQTYRKKFGVWPVSQVVSGVGPIIPDRTFKNYLTYLNIKYSAWRNKK